MQADRQIYGSSVVLKAGGRERWRAQQGFYIVWKTVAFRWDPQPVGVKLAVHILIMNDGNRIRSRRDVFKVATRLCLPNFYYHNIRCRDQKLNRETHCRVEKRAIYGSSSVSNVQNLHVNSGALWGLGKGYGGEIRKHQHCKQYDTRSSHGGPVWIEKVLSELLNNTIINKISLLSISKLGLRKLSFLLDLRGGIGMGVDKDYWFAFEILYYGTKTNNQYFRKGSSRECFLPAICRISRAYWVGPCCKQHRVPPLTNSRSFG